MVDENKFLVRWNGTADGVFKSLTAKDIDTVWAWLWTFGSSGSVSHLLLA